VQLLGIDRVDGDAAIDEGIDQRAAVELQGDSDPLRLALGEPDQPVEEGREGLTGVLDRAFRQDLAVAIEHAGVMFFGSPIDTYEQRVFGLLHASTPPGSGEVRDHGSSSSLYWRSRRDFLLDVSHGLPAG